MEISEYFGDWMEVLPDIKVLEKYRANIVALKRNNISFEPDVHNVFRAFRLTKLKDCKVIIIGQDPYPQHQVATGLAFANNFSLTSPDNQISPSLRVIRDSVLSLANPDEIPIFDPTLESWAAQGILLLNSALTVRTNQPGSHSEAWFPFLSTLVEKTSLKYPDIFWMLMGKSAWRFEECLNLQSKRITEYHPAYFARTNTKMGNWLWKRMIDHVKERYGVTLKLYD